MNFGLSFTNPWALLLWPPLVAYSAWLVGRSLADLSPLRRRLALAMRVLVITLLVLALAGLQIVRFNRDLAVMFVVDYSDSVAASAKDSASKYIRTAVAKRRPRDRWGVVVFGSEAYIDLAPGTAPTLGKIQTVPRTEFTDIAAAIRLAVASLPDGMQKRLVILSDGNENLGNALDETQVAANNDITIDVVPLSAPQQHEALLEKITMPSEAKIGEPIEIKVVGRATQATDAQIKLFRDGKFLGSRNVHLARGKSVLVFPQTVTEAGAATFEAQLETAPGVDTVAENNRALGLINVQGKPRVLMVSGEPDQARFLVQALQREKVNVELRGPGGLPPQLRAMQAYDAIILNNVPAWDLGTKQMQALQSYVRDLGCGLVMVGGENSYGPGGYRETPIEETLPVTMDIKNMQYIPGGAVAMIMHSCEFTGGNDWAKSVCSQVTRQLGDNDHAGLIVFGFGPSWVYPGGMLRVGPNRSLMLTKIRGINPGDMPSFDNTLELAYQGLVKTKAYLKHCIILSDGDPSPPVPALIRKLNAAKITVSTVVIQPHEKSGEDNMRAIARQHRGKFYRVTNPRQIPNIFLKEAATVSRSAIIEEPFTPRREEGSSIIKGITSMPPLLGYVGTSSKPTAQTPLTSHQSDPVLATWQYGLGKSVAFTSDARQRWAAGWLGWAGFAKFWAQTVRWSMRQSSSTDLQTMMDIDKGRGKITIEAVDAKGNFINFLNPKARLVTPDLKGVNLSLDQTGPGRYEATFDARQLGMYLVNIQTRRGDKTVSQITGAVLPYSPEYNSVGTNQFLLWRIAKIGGGEPVALDKADQVFARPRVAARLPRDVWLLLLMVAACLFPLDVAVRRLMWGEAEVESVLARLRRGSRKRGSTVRKTPVRDEAMDRLLRTKTTAAQRGAAPETPPQRTPAPTQPAPTQQVSAPPSAPPPPGGSGQVAQPHLQPPVTVQPEPEPVEPAEPTLEELDPIERLRRAKRRARGEE
ncbi:MAG TPA: glutamine amidotransferase [Abditibacteriaceae bacterium]|nr:glutamine amidotransferase [Abditibacteriaceae bacterium]